MIHITNNNIIFQNEIKIKVEPINARSVGVRINRNYSLKLNKYNEIQEVVIKGGYSIKIGDSILAQIKSNEDSYDKSKYVVNKIAQGTQSMTNYDLIIYEEILNKTSYYLLPTLGRDRMFFNTDKRLLNCYVEDNYKFLRLKYRFSTIDSFIELDRNLKTHPLYRSSVQYDIYSIIYIFRIPDRFQEDVIKVLDGKYSKLSPALKKAIIKSASSFQADFFNRVLSRDEELKKHLEKDLNVTIPNDIELDSKPFKQLEIWTKK